MADPFTGEIRAFGFNYAPMDWAFCDGRPVPVQQNPALFSLIGAIYGGDGKTTFNLPNLQSRVVMGTMAPGSSNKLNLQSGTQLETLTLGQLPNHVHNLAGETTNPQASRAAAPANTVVPNRVFNGTILQKAYSTTATPNTMLSPGAIGPNGGDGAHENLQPYLALNFCICTNGVYPNLQD